LIREQAQSMGLAISDVYSAVQLMLAPVYVNDFIFEGRVLRVTMQADAPYRMNEESLQRFYLPAGTTGTMASAFAGDNSSDGMVPLSSVLRSNWVVAAPSQSRFNGFPAIQLNGGPKLDEGKSTGEAMAEMERIVREDLPPGLGYDWAGQSYQERLSGAEAPMLFALSILVVFLCLAALYESWATPIAVLLVVPVGIIGSVFAAKAAGMPNDVFFKVGLITIIGLAAKNAILIVEFAIEEQKRGKALVRVHHRGVATATSPHSHDVVRLHFGRAAAGLCDRRRRQRAARIGYGRGWRYAFGRDPRRIAGADLLRGDPAHGRRKAEHS
jgi:multidrug efflux pump